MNAAGVRSVRRGRQHVALWLILACSQMPGDPAWAQVVDTTLWVANGVVNAVVRAGNTVYIGGGFTHVGPATGGGVPIGAGGAPVIGFPKVTGDVWTVAPDGSGGWYIGGLFSRVGGLPRANLARVLSDNTVSSWNPGASSNVIALAVSGTTVYVGGNFSSAGGQVRGRLAALDATTGLATPWNPNANNDVWALGVIGTTVYVGGEFTSVGGSSRSYAAALDASTGLATPWNPDANERVLAIATSGTTVYVGGQFTVIGGQSRSRIAALDATTGLATAWNPNAVNTVRALAVDRALVYAGGSFTTIGGAQRSSIAALDSASGSATAWNPDLNGYDVRALALSGTTVYAGGDFASVGGQVRNNLAALDASTGLPTAWNPNATSTVFALAVNGVTVYAGGTFSSIGGVARSRIAALDATTGIATAWDPGVEGSVDALAASGTTVYVGGAFGTFFGFARSCLAAVDATTGLTTTWNPSAQGGGVRALAVSGTTVYVGGQFTNVGGQARSRLAALDATTGLATGWDPNADGAVRALAVTGAAVYAGGLFTSIGGLARNHIAEIDVATGIATSWSPDANSDVWSLVASGATVYASGYFTSVGGQARNYLAALDATTGLATAWNPGANSSVHALAMSGATVYAGGQFTSVGGQARNRLGALDATTGLATAWNPNANQVVLALAASGTTIYAGGDFRSVGGQPQSRIVAIVPASFTLTASSGPNGTIAPAGAVVVAAGSSQLFAITPAPGYRVLDVLVDGGSVGPVTQYTFTNVQTDHTIAATFGLFILTASAGANGVISPSGTVPVTAGSDQAFTITPNPGYRVLDVRVDGISVGPVTQYTFTNVQADHTIAATFVDWEIRSDFYVADGPVRATALSPAGDVLYIGGDFTHVGPQTGHGIAIDQTTGLPAGPIPKVTRDVLTVVSDGSGGWYIGGYFDSVGGVPRAGIARVLADGTVSSWNPNANGAVSALVVIGSTIYAGGLFTSIGGAARNRIAALDATTGAATAWDPNANNQVTVLTVSGSTVYAGGLFTSIGGAARSRIAALDATSGTATPWNPSANNQVSALAVIGSTVYAGGFFTSIGGQTRNRIAALDSTTGAAKAWNPNANNQVIALAASGSTIYAGGSFTSIGGQARNRIAALDTTDGTPTTWNPNADSTVAALAVSGATVYVGGHFINIAGQSRKRIAAVDASTGAATDWNPNAYSGVLTLAVGPSTVYLGGNFSTIGGQVRNRVAALNTATGEATTWNPDANAIVRSLAASGSTVYAAGDFTSIGGQSRNRIAALDTISGAPTAWDANANNQVIALAVSGSTVYAGGSFTSIGGVARNRIAALDATSGTATPWNPSANNQVSALAVSGSTVYAGGSFTNIGAQGRFRIAALDATTGAAREWVAGLQGGSTARVLALAASGSTVYAGGFFSSVDANQTHVAAFDAATGEARWSETGANATVRALAVSGSTVYAGGDFFIVGGQGRQFIAALDATSGAATTWNPLPLGSVLTLAVNGETVWAGGSFTYLSPQSREGIAAIARGAFTMTPSVGPGGTITPSGAVTLPVGSDQSFSVAPDAGYRVLDVVVDGTSLGPVTSHTFTNVRADHTISATFEPDVFTITAGAGASGTISPPGAVVVAAGSNRTFTVTPNPGSQLHDVLVDGASVGPVTQYTFTNVQADHTISASFDAFVITASAGANGVISPLGAIPVAPGGTQTLTITPSPGYRVQDVFVDGAPVGPVSEYTFNNVQADHTIAAAFVDFEIRSDFYVTDGEVDATALSPAGDVLYIGGMFTHVGPPTGHGLAIDQTTGLAAGSIAKVTGGPVRTVVPDGSGGWYIGGDFLFVAGAPRARIARVLADGTVSSWNPGANSTVYKLVVSGSTLYAGGSFTSIGGVARNRIAALNVGTGAATAWDPNANGAIHALVVSGATVYAGGSFTSIGGAARNRIAALDASTGAPTAWDPNANGAINALAVSGATVYAGGDFYAIGGLIRQRIAALDATTGAAMGWDPSANGVVNALEVSGSTIYVGGSFTSVGGQVRSRIAALDAASGIPTAWDPNASGTIYALAVSGASVYAGGSFTSVGGQTRYRVAALDTGTGAATAWNPHAYSTVLALAVGGSTVYAGGELSRIGGLVRNRLAALDVATGIATAWNPDANSNVAALVASGSTVYAGGSFTGVGGQPRNFVAALDTVTGAPTAWDPNANGLVYALAVSGSTVYVSGNFTSIGGQSRNRIAAFDATTGAIRAWNPNSNNAVLALAVTRSTVYAGGYFSSIGGQFRQYIAALDSTSGLATSWDAILGSEPVFGIESVAMSGSTVYVGGQGQLGGYIAAIDATNGEGRWIDWPNSTVRGLAVSGPTVYVGGEFGLTARDTTTGAATAWNPNANGRVNGLVVNGSTVYAGGSFTRVGHVPQSYVAGITAVSFTITASAGPDGAIVPSGVVSVAPGGNRSFTVVPNPGYRILDVLVDGASIGPVTQYTFPNVQTNHTIAASFAPNLTGIVTPAALIAADLDGDGKSDLATASATTSALSVLRNTSVPRDILFAPAVGAAPDALPNGLAVVDLDGDGKLDLVTANRPDNTVSLNRNTGALGTPAFATEVHWPVGSNPAAVAVGDVDRDGKPDVVVANAGSNSFTVLRNSSTPGSPNVVPHNLPNGGSPQHVTLVDLDGDGALDVVTANQGDNSLSVHRNISVPGNPKFEPRLTFLTASQPAWVAAADIDGDTQPDLVVANRGANSISVFRNTGALETISFAPRVDVAVGTSPAALALGDTDGDGRPDVVTANSGAATVSVLRNTSPPGGVTFAPRVDQAVGATPLGVVIADFDGDGKADIATADRDGGSLTVLRNSASVTLTPVAGAGGSIVPSSPLILPDGASQTFYFRPNQQMKVQDVRVDGLSVGAVASYRFSALNVSRTIEVSFAHDPALAASGWAANGVPAVALGASQDEARSIPDGAGGTIIAWKDGRSGNGDIYVQRLNAAGVPMWSGGGVSVCSSPDHQYSPRILPDGMGGAIVVWHGVQGGVDSDIHAQRVNAAGVPQWAANGVSICSAAGDQYGQTVVPDGAGGAIVAWNDQRSGAWKIFAQRITANGTVQWGQDGVPLCSAPGDQVWPEIASDGAGGAILAWWQADGANWDIRARRVDNAGAPQWSASGLVLCGVDQAFGPASALEIDMIPDGAGGAIVGWSDRRLTATPRRIYAQRVSGGGVVAWATDGVRLCAAQENQGEPTLTPDGSGGAIVAWWVNPGSNWDVHAQHVNAGGTPSWGPDGVPVCTAAGNQYNQTTTSDGAGGVVVTWHDTRAGNLDIYAQRVSPIGAPLWLVVGGVAVCVATDDQTYPIPVTDGAGGVIMAWVDRRNGLDLDVFAQRVTGVGTIGFDHVVTAIASGGGTVVPAGSVGVFAATSQTFAFAPAGNSRVLGVSVDAVPVPAAASYSLGSIAANHTLAVTFAPNAPIITSISPSSSPVGSALTIKGQAFGSTPAANVVMFGGVRAAVTAASSDTQLTVTVPAGAAHALISVTIANLTGYSRGLFTPTFASAGLLDSTSLPATLTIPVGNQPHFVGAGDIDGDGKVDLVVAKEADDSVSVYRNTTSGALSFEGGVSFATFSTPNGVSLADLDGDGRLDLTYVQTNSRVLSARRNLSSTGNISFSTAVDSSTGAGSQPHISAVGDLDLDGRPDVVVNSGRPWISVFRNTTQDSAISFAPRLDFPTGANSAGVAIGDLDGDGRPEIALASLDTDSLSIFRNLSTPGNLAFGPRQDFAAGDGAYEIALTDLDGDGKLDIVTSNQNSATLIAFRNTSIPGTVSLVPQATISVGLNPRRITAADLDGDGRPDLAVVNHDSHTMSVVRNTSASGSISFASRSDLATGTGPIGACAPDLDGDGRPELISSNLQAASASLFRNLGSHAITASAGANGAVFPSGTVAVPGGGSSTFLIQPNQRSRALDVLVDGAPQGPISRYTFSNVMAPHTIAASYVTDSLEAPPPFKLAWGNFGSGEGQFISAVDVAVDAQGFSYVVDYGNNRIQKFAGDGNYVTQWGGSGTGDGQFTDPGHVGVDGSGRIYVSEFTNSRIQVFDSNGQYLSKWGSQGGGPGQFFHPLGFAIDGNGDIYVADQGNSRIEVFDASFSYLRQWGSLGSGPGQFNQAYDVALGGDGNVYVTDGNNNRIQVFDRNGVYLRQWGTPGNGNGQFDFPHQLEIDGVGSVYVSDNHNRRIQKFTSAGAFITAWGDSGTGPGQFNNPIGLALDGSGYLLVTDAFSRPIQKFGFDHRLTITAGPGGAVAPSGSVGVIAGSSQMITATPAAGFSVAEIRVDGALVGTGPSDTLTNITADHTVSVTFTQASYAISATAGPNGAVFPSGTVVVPYGGSQTFLIQPNQRSRVLDVLVDSSTQGPITRYTFSNVTAPHAISATFASDATEAPPPFKLVWGSFGTGNGQFNQPAGVASDAAGDVYVADYLNHRIQKFTNTGTYITQWGSFGTGDGQFNKPLGVATDAAGSVFVVDYLNHRIQKFTDTGTYITQWGGLGAGNGQFNQPVGVETDGAGNVYVADDNNHRIQKFTDTGTYLTQWGSFGTGGGQFNHPTDVATDAAGNLHVSDNFNHRIQKFTDTGTYLTQWGGIGAGDGQLNQPVGVETDGAGNVYVADDDNHRIQMFTDTGTYLTRWGSFGTSNGQFDSPFGIATHAAGIVYVTDAGNHRIQRFGFDHRLDITPGPNGAVAPSGVVGIIAGSSHLIAPVPDLGYRVSEIRVDGALVSTGPAYTLANITANHAIDVSFVPSTASLGTNAYLVLSHGFEDAQGNCQPRGWVGEDLASRVYAHVTSRFTNVFPLQGTRAFWFGADSSVAPAEIATWVRSPATGNAAHGYGNNWSQRLTSPPFSRVANPNARLSFDARIEFDAALPDQLRDGDRGNEFVAVQAMKSDGTWAFLNVRWGAVTDSAVTGRTNSPITPEVRLDDDGNQSLPLAEPARLRIVVQTDSAGSSEDGLHSAIGAALIDNIRLRQNAADIVPATDFEDGTTGVWIRSALNGAIRTPGANASVTRDLPSPGSNDSLRTAFDPHDPTCVWTFAASPGDTVPPGTYARITSPWFALASPGADAVISFTGKLNTANQYRQVRPLVRGKNIGDLRPRFVAPLSTPMNSGTVGADADVPLLVGRELRFPQDFGGGQNADSLQLVFQIEDRPEMDAAQMPRPPTRLPFLDDVRVHQLAVDSDGDGVANALDACPTVSAAGEDADGDGCLDSTATMRHVEMWTVADRPIRYRLSAAGSPNVNDGSDLDAIRAAFAAWSQISGSSVTIVEEGTTAQTDAGVLDGVNLITFADDYSFPSNVLAITTTTSFTRRAAFNDRAYLPGQIADADMLFNPDVAFGTAGTGPIAGGFDLQSVAMHEAGHFLGLTHTGVQDATMFPVLQPGRDASTLEDDDRAGLASAYPTPELASTFGSIKGVVIRGGSGEPMPGALILAVRLDGGGVPIDSTASDFTREDGSYALYRLPPARYGVRIAPLDGSVPGLLPGAISKRVEAIARTDFPAEWWSTIETESDDADVRTPIPLVAGQARTGINLVTNTDVTPPSVVAITPGGETLDLPVDTPVLMTFSEAIDKDSFELAFSLRSTTGDTTRLDGVGRLIQSGRVVVFTASDPLNYDTRYQVQISTALTDRAGVPLAAPYVTYFRTADAPSLATTGLLPPRAPAGAVVTLRGVGFDAATPADHAARFTCGGCPDAPALAVTSNSMSVMVPYGAVSGPVHAVRGGVPSTTSADLQVLTPSAQLAPTPSGLPIALGFEPLDIVLTPDGAATVTVGEGGVTTIRLIPGPGFREAVTSAIGRTTHVALRPDRLEAYVSQPDSGRILVMEPDVSGVFSIQTGAIAVDGSPGAIAFTPDGRRAFVADTEDGVIHEIATYAPGGSPVVVDERAVAGLSLAGGIVVDATGRVVYFTSRNAGLHQIDLATGTLSSTGGDAGAGAAVSPDNREALFPSAHGLLALRGALGTGPLQATAVPLPGSARDVAVGVRSRAAYVANPLLGRLQVVDLDTARVTYRTVVGSVATGASPVAVATDDDGSTIAVANAAGRSVTLYDLLGGGGLLSVTPDVAVPGEQAAVLAGGSNFASGTQVDVGELVVPVSEGLDVGATFRVPATYQRATTVTLVHPGAAMERTLALPFGIVDPIAPVAPRATSVVRPAPRVACATDSGFTPLQAIRLSPAGALAATLHAAANVGTCVAPPAVMLWQASERGPDVLGDWLTSRPLPVDAVLDAAFTPDGARLWIATATAGSHAIQVLDADPASIAFGTIVDVLASPALGAISLLTPDPLGRWMIAASTVDQSVKLLSASGAVLDSFDVSPHTPLAIAQARDGRHLVVGVEDRALFYDLVARARVATSAAHPGNPVGAITLTRDGRRAVGRVGSSQLETWSLELPVGQPVGSLISASGTLGALVPGPAAATVLAGCADCASLFELDLSGALPVLATTPMGRPGAAMASSGDGRRLWLGATGGGAATPDSLVLHSLSRASRAELISGAGQLGLPGEILPVPVRIQLTDSLGRPQQGVVVRFELPDLDHGVIDGRTGTRTLYRITDVAGEAAVSWRLPATPRAVSLSLEGEGVPGAIAVQSEAVPLDALAAPVVVELVPAMGDTGISVSTPVLARFSQRMDSSSVSLKTTLTANGNRIEGRYTLVDGGRSLHFQPRQPLPFGAACVLAVEPGAMDQEGQALAGTGTTSFTAENPPELALAGIDPPAGVPGTPVVLSGRGFSSVPGHNTVLFTSATGSLIAPASSASDRAMVVNVPHGAISGNVEVRVAALASNPVGFTVLEPNADPGVPSDSIIVPVGSRALAVTPDGERAYLTNPRANSVAGVHLSQLQTVVIIPVGYQPTAIEIMPWTELAYVANLGSHDVSVIDVRPASATYHRVTRTIPVGRHPVDLAISPAGSSIVVVNAGDSTLSIIDGEPTHATFHHVTKTVKLGSGGSQIVISADGTFAYVATSDGVAIVDLAGDQVTKTVKLGSGGSQIVISADGTLLFVLTGNGVLAVIDIAPRSATLHQVTKTVKLGSGGSQIVISADGTLLLVSFPDRNEVQVFRIVTSGSGQGTLVQRPGPVVDLTLVAVIPVGVAPAGLAADPHGEFALVANEGSGTLTVIPLQGSAPLAIEMELKLDRFRLAPFEPYATVYLEPQFPRTPAGIRIGSLRLASLSSDSTTATTGDRDGDSVPDLATGFLREALLAALPEGPAVPVTITGVLDTLSFVARDTVRVRRGEILWPTAGALVHPGSLQVIFYDRSRNPGTISVAVLHTAGSGQPWVLDSSDQPNSGRALWTAPSVPLDSLRVAIVMVEQVHADTSITGVFVASDYFTVATAVDAGDQIPVLSLAPMAPNPARGPTHVLFSLSRRGPVSVDLIDVQGRRVRALASGERAAGNHRLVWNGESTRGARVGSGVYFVRMRAEGRELVRRFVWMP